VEELLLVLPVFFMEDDGDDVKEWTLRLALEVDEGESLRYNAGNAASVLFLLLLLLLLLIIIGSDDTTVIGRYCC
jgi:hypothetical protein